MILPHIPHTGRILAAWTSEMLHGICLLSQADRGDEVVEQNHGRLGIFVSVSFNRFNAQESILITDQGWRDLKKCCDLHEPISVSVGLKRLEIWLSSWRSWFGHMGVFDNEGRQPICRQVNTNNDEKTGILRALCSKKPTSCCFPLSCG